MATFHIRRPITPQPKGERRNQRVTFCGNGSSEFDARHNWEVAPYVGVTGLSLTPCPDCIARRGWATFDQIPKKGA